MITPSNLIAGYMLLLVYSCTSPASAPQNGPTPTMLPGRFEAEVNQQTTYQTDTTTYFLQQWPGAVITTPKGGLFRLRLPNGTGMLLNSATRLSFPMQTDAGIQVTLTGEAFLTTTTDPVHLSTGSVLLNVPAQSSVNIKSYVEDQVTTISPGKGTVQLLWEKKHYTVPAGQQAILQDRKMKIQAAKSEITEGWRSGLFTEAEPLLLLREVARWYDVELLIESSIPVIQLEGTLPRSASLQDLITILQANEIPVRYDTTRPALIIQK